MLLVVTSVHLEDLFRLPHLLLAVEPEPLLKLLREVLVEHVVRPQPVLQPPPRLRPDVGLLLLHPLVLQQEGHVGGRPAEGVAQQNDGLDERRYLYLKSSFVTVESNLFEFLSDEHKVELFVQLGDLLPDEGGVLQVWRGHPEVPEELVLADNGLLSSFHLYGVINITSCVDLFCFYTYRSRTLQFLNHL